MKYGSIQELSDALEKLEAKETKKAAPKKETKK